MNGQYLMNREISVQYAYKKDGKGLRHGTNAERTLAAEARKRNVQIPIQPLPPQLFAPPTTVNASSSAVLNGAADHARAATHSPAGFHAGSGFQVGAPQGGPQAPRVAPSPSPLPPPSSGLPPRPPPSLAGYGGPVGFNPPGFGPPPGAPPPGFAPPPGATAFPPGFAPPGGAPPGMPPGFQQGYGKR